jgi:hypothetical protein
MNLLQTLLSSFINSCQMDYTAEDVLIKASNYSGECLDILYLNRRKGGASLVLLSDEQVKNALLKMAYITDYSDHMVMVPAPVFATDVPGFSWMDTGNFIRVNLDDSMSMSLLLHYLNKIAG